MLEIYLTHFLAILLLLPCQVCASPSTFATVTKAPILEQGALYKRANDSNTCGYFSGNAASPDICPSAQICQWIYPTTGSIGQMICQTNGAVVGTLNPYCVNYGATKPSQCSGSQSSSCLANSGNWAFCQGTAAPQCQTILYASGPGDSVEFSSIRCIGGANASPTIYVYLSPTSTSAATAFLSSSFPKTTISPTAATPTSSSSIATSSPSSSKSSSGVSPGATAGIVIGILAVVLVIAFIIFRNHRRSNSGVTNGDQQERKLDGGVPMAQPEGEGGFSGGVQNTNQLPELLGTPR